MQVGGAAGGTYLMPTLCSQPRMVVPESPCTTDRTAKALNKLRVEILMVGARGDECVALQSRRRLLSAKPVYYHFVMCTLSCKSQVSVGSRSNRG